MKKKDLLYICVLVAVSCFLFSCGEKKKQLTPKEEFLMGLTAEDTVQVLTISRSCMDTLKAGNIDEALKMLFILLDGKAIPLPAEKEQQLRKKFKYFPVVDYKLDYYSFSSTDNNDVKFQIEFNPANVKGYRQIGYENRALADADFANDAVDGGEIGAGHMVTVLYEIVPAGSDFDVPAAEHKYGQDSNQANTSETASQDVKDKSDSAEDYTGELATVNVRYKEPDGDKSSLVSRVVKTDSYSSEMSVDMSAASAVAAYGMILKNSEYVGSADFDMVMALVGGKVDSSAGSGDIIDMQWQGFADMVRQTQNITD